MILLYFVPEGESASDLKKFIFESCIKLWTKDNLEVFKEIFTKGYTSDNLYFLSNNPFVTSNITMIFTKRLVIHMFYFTYQSTE